MDRSFWNSRQAFLLEYSMFFLWLAGECRYLSHVTLEEQGSFCQSLSLEKISIFWMKIPSATNQQRRASQCCHAVPSHSGPHSCCQRDRTVADPGQDAERSWSWRFSYTVILKNSLGAFQTVETELLYHAAGSLSGMCSFPEKMKSVCWKENCTHTLYSVLHSNQGRSGITLGWFQQVDG